MENQGSSTSSVSFASSVSPQYIMADINEHPITGPTISDIKQTYKYFDSIIDNIHQQDLTPTVIENALGTLINEDLAQTMEEAFSGEEDPPYNDHE
eukprot:3235428-Ditylum_brightwellii.AAC.1